MKTRPLTGLLAPSLLALTLGCTMPSTTDFDADTWKAQRGVDASENRRGTMVEALERTVRVGMPRDEVIALLGEPDASGPDADDADARTDTYELGVSPLGVDEEVYRITYRDGAVASLEWQRR